jgi:hypothetical protein
MFLAAKRVLRIHPDWTNEQVADNLAIPKLLISETVAVARKEIEQDGDTRA